MVFKAEMKSENGRAAITDRGDSSRTKSDSCQIVQRRLCNYRKRRTDRCQKCITETVMHHAYGTVLTRGMLCQYLMGDHSELRNQHQRYSNSGDAAISQIVNQVRHWGETITKCNLRVEPQFLPSYATAHANQRNLTADRLGTNQEIAVRPCFSDADSTEHYEYAQPPVSTHPPW